MACSYTVIIAFALLVGFTTHSTMALPKGRPDEENDINDRMISIAGDNEINDLGTGLLSLRRYPIIEGRLADEDGTKRIFILAETGMKGYPGRDGNLAFPRSVPTLPLRGMDHALEGFSAKDERRSADDVIPVGRRDIDMLRCMIGRVYRPCWQA